MRVLNVNIVLDPVFGGGTAERTYQMSKALTNAGIECTILTSDIGLSNERIASLNGVNLVVLRCLIKRFYIMFFSWRDLKKLIARVDVIHLMGHWRMLNVVVYLLAIRSDTPYVICPAGELTLFGRSSWLKKLFNVVIGHRIVRNASGHIAVTPDEIPVFESFGVNADSVIVIPNAINEIDFQYDEGDSFSQSVGLNGKPFILFMGRLNFIKGPDLLLKAFCAVAKQFPSYHLVFAGPDGGMLSELQQLSKDESIGDRVHFIGYIAGKDKANAYHEAEFLVIPSRQEAMSIVVLEAGICCTPVLLTDRCGFNDVEAVDGGLVVQATINELVNGLIEMITKQHQLEGMGIKLKNFVYQNYTWKFICKQYQQLYKKVI